MCVVGYMSSLFAGFLSSAILNQGQVMSYILAQWFLSGGDGEWGTDAVRIPGEGEPGFVVVSLGCHKKYHRLGGLNYRHLFYHSSRGQTSMIKVPANFVSGEGSLVGLQEATFSLSSPGLSVLTRRGEIPASLSLLRTPVLLD